MKIHPHSDAREMTTASEESSEIWRQSVCNTCSWHESKRWLTLGHNVSSLVKPEKSKVYEGILYKRKRRDKRNEFFVYCQDDFAFEWTSARSPLYFTTHQMPAWFLLLLFPFFAVTDCSRFKWSYTRFFTVLFFLWCISPSFPCIFLHDSLSLMPVLAKRLSSLQRWLFFGILRISFFV